MKAKIQALNDKKDDEIQKAIRKVHGNRKELKEALGDINLNQICRCPNPNCSMLIIKNGGCSSMSCICGCHFRYFDYILSVSLNNEMEESRKKIEESFQPLQKKYHQLIQLYEGMVSPCRSLKTPAKKKASRAPLLQFDEPDDFYRELDDIILEDDGYSSEDYDEVETTSTEDSTHLSVPSDLDSTSSFPSVSLLEADTATVKAEPEQDFEALELASDACDDSWSQCGCSEIETMVMNDNDFRTTCSSQTTDWEEVSEVSSVVSFNSKSGMSFLEAARASNQNRKWKEVSSPKNLMMIEPRRLQTITEQRGKVTDDDIFEMFDADFIFDGMKYSRGGKLKFKTKVLE